MIEDGAFDCETCPAGRSQSASGQSECVVCAAGRFSAEGNNIPRRRAIGGPSSNFLVLVEIRRTRYEGRRRVVLTENSSYFRERKGLAAPLRQPPRPLRVEPIVQRLDLLPPFRRTGLSTTWRCSGGGRTRTPARTTAKKLGACGLLKPAGDAAAQVSKMPRTPRLRVLPRAMRVVARA